MTHEPLTCFKRTASASNRTLLFFKQNRRIFFMYPNALQPSFPDSSDRVNLFFEQLRGEISTVLSSEASLRETVRHLEHELGVYRRAYTGVEAERQRFQEQRDDLENQLKGHRIVALIDGDGVIFNDTLISQGQSGGHLAALRLSDALVQHLTSTNGYNQYQLWVYIFLNKRGLMETFERAHFASKHHFEEFIIGFNQAAERFMMVDVGSGKEAADAKIKAFLEDEIRLPQTEKIIFGGCHDNGYVTTLRSQITAGFKNKLILLPGYTNIAMGINDLDLPSFNIPDLFTPHKLVVPATMSSNPSSMTSVKNASPQLSKAEVHDTPAAIKPAPPTNEQAFSALPFASVEVEPFIPPSYSSALQTPHKRVVTPELTSGDSSASSDGSDESSPRVRPILVNGRARRVNSNIPLSKHKPPPCTLFYLSSCKHGVDCKYAHDYILEAEHFNEIRLNARKSPCPSKNKGEVCLWGDDCCYGHHCPLATKCHFLKQNRCKFVGADMHKDPKVQF